MEINEYVIEFMMRNNGVSVVQRAYVSATSPKEAVEKFKEMFKGDNRVEEIRDVLMLCTGWR